ncbi:MAG TPA: xanthine dehydrogenase family protein molybdopterin-binding subunit [Candidatus Dormibacteraeota bacterium]|nr:xanthine dehydrogenase family protein molybdopterin-binding subunit [Candidatus Dormibacteraeota bacterium]
MSPVESSQAPNRATTRFGIGQAVRRVEDRRFLMGRGRYVEDVNLPGQAYAAVVRSPHAHARILAVRTEAAMRKPGVLCVLTGAEVEADHLQGLTASAMPEDMGAPPGHRTFRPILVRDRARFVGDGVALVVAETAAQACDAAEAVEVEYEPLPAVVDLEDAVAPGAPKVHDDCPNGNVAWTLTFGDQAVTDAALATATHRLSLRLENNRLSANPIEPRGAVGEFDPATGCYTLHTSTQNPHGVRQQLAAVLNIPETALRVIGPDVGGGFGMKADAYPEDALVLWASRRCGRPVKWMATRSESLLTDTHGRDQVVVGELAFDDAGRILGIRAQALHALGAYVAPAGLVPSVFALRFIPGPYDVQAVHLVTRGVFTNTAPLGPYRGAGRPEATYLTERLLDEAAAELGLDPAEIRRRNLIKPDALPYLTATAYTYDSGDFPRVLQRCLELADWDGFPERRAKSERRGLRRGRAITYFIEQGGVFNDRMELRFDPGGTVTIVAGTFSHGQGHATTYTQMVHEWLGIPFDRIRFLQGDTDQVPFGRGTYAARSSMVGGCALRRAADAIIEKARPMAAELLEAAGHDLEFVRGEFRVVGTDRTISLMEVARAFYHPMGITDRFGVGLEASGTWSTTPENFPNGCHVAEVEVDPETGEVVVDRYTTVDDVGRAINPLICEGQIQGGLAQGLGQALLEHVVYDRQTGQLLTGTLGDYGMPRVDSMPALTTALEEIPCTTNPLGVKGVAEASTVGAPPTVINAILDALRPLGVRHLDMPATPARVWDAIQRARR